MARLFRLLPDPSRAHEPRSVDRPKITLVSVAAVAERAQSLQRTAPSWRAKVQCSGRRRFTDGVLAHVRTPGGPTSAAQPLLPLTRSAPTLCPSLTRSNRRGTDPYARWWGRGGTARCPPIPINPRIEYGPSPGIGALGGNDFATSARQDRPRKIAGSAMSEQPGPSADLAAALRWRPASDKFRLLAGSFLALFALYGATYLAVAAAKGWPAGFGDSFALWSFGRYLSDHAAITIYDPIALRTTQ